MTIVPEKPENHWAKQGSLQLLSGSMAGLVEVCCMQPLDVVTTRLQLQRPADSGLPHYCRNVFRCMRQIYRQEGLTSLWRGIVPDLMAETPKRATKFLCFEQFQPLYERFFGVTSPTALTITLSGFSAGFVEGALSIPFEVVKLMQQSNLGKFHERPGAWATMRDIVKTDGFGFAGLHRGAIATMLRYGSFNCVYFGVYHNARHFIQAVEENEYWRVVAGCSAGALACFFDTPFDVTKTRIQGPQPQPGIRKYRSVLQTMTLVYKEEGFRALYKGLTPKIMSLGPGGGIMFLVYELVYDILEFRYL